MGLTNAQMRMIMALASNNIKDARKYAIICMDEDHTKKNERFCQRYKKMLLSMSDIIELPHKLKSMIVVEDVQHTFNEARYLLTDSEREAYEKIKKMNKISEKLMEMDISCTNSMLLHGETRVGKTMFGRYVAYKMWVPFCYLNFSGMINSLLGQTAKNIHEVFEWVSMNKCVLMLDELDCISQKRNSEGNRPDEELVRVTISIMQEMDNLPCGFILLAATNRLDRIDDVLISRFYHVHHMVDMSASDKGKLSCKFLLDVGVELPEEDIVAAQECANPAEVIRFLVSRIIDKLYQENL